VPEKQPLYAATAVVDNACQFLYPCPLVQPGKGASEGSMSKVPAGRRAAGKHETSPRGEGGGHRAVGRIVLIRDGRLVRAGRLSGAGFRVRRGGASGRKS